MTAKEYENKIDELLKQHGGIENIIRRTCMSIVKPKYLQEQFLDPAENDSFMLPKAAITAVLRELAWQHEPVSAQGKDIVKELKPYTAIVF